MKLKLLRRNLFVFALAASMLAATLPALAPRADAAPRQRKAAATAPQAAQQKPAPAPAPSGPLAEAAPFVNKVLPNGLEVIVLEDHSVPLVTVELAVRNGSFTEPPELNGLSHLYEHMFFKVSPERAAKADYLTNIDQLGIVYNGETHEEVVDYYFTTTTPNFPVALRFMRDQARFQSFDEGQFAQEKEVVIGELERNESNPFGDLGDEMNGRLFYKFPSRKRPGGDIKTVHGATTDMMRLIQSRYYVPNNSAIVVTGDVNPQTVFQMVEDSFGDWPRRPKDPFVEFPLVEHPPLPKSEGAVLTRPVNNVVVELGWQGPSIGKDDAATYAADVFSFILRQPNSRFQRALVDTGLVTAVGFGYYTQRNVGPISLVIQTTPDKARAAVQAAYKEVAHFNDPDYFTDEELESAKALVEADDLYSREKLSDYSHTISFWWASTGLDYFRGYLKRLRATSRSDISRYVSTYIQGKPHVGLALMSEDSLKASGVTESDLIGSGAAGAGAAASGR
ncbi:MAG TPA: pitrilysin family protein [Pyrinomonadaceae bacterium]|jgi:zinc protease|nr:pitrilysin family protein [Pyrinomonadaceae bacterium]